MSASAVLEQPLALGIDIDAAFDQVDAIATDPARDDLDERAVVYATVEALREAGDPQAEVLSACMEVALIGLAGVQDFDEWASYLSELQERAGRPLALVRPEVQRSLLLREWAAEGDQARRKAILSYLEATDPAVAESDDPSPFAPPAGIDGYSIKSAGGGRVRVRLTRGTSRFLSAVDPLDGDARERLARRAGEALGIGRGDARFLEHDLVAVADSWVLDGDDDQGEAADHGGTPAAADQGGTPAGVEAAVPGGDGSPAPQQPAARLDVPVGWALTIVDSEPPMYQLSSPYWSGNLTLTGGELRNFAAVCRAALAQKAAWLPSTFGGGWRDTKKRASLPQKLVLSARHEAAPAEVKRSEVIAEQSMDVLASSARRTLKPNQKPTVTNLPCRDSQGDVWFAFGWLWGELSRGPDKITRSELSAVLALLGAEDRTIGRGDTKRVVKVLPSSVVNVRGVCSRMWGEV